jgi:hypothetical protein
MTTQDESAERSTLFQGTVSAGHDVVRAIGELDIDRLLGSEQINDTRTSFEALLRLDQVEALVTAGATVTLKRTIDRTFPTQQLLAQVDPLERLRVLEPFREDQEK